jgi:hypothetical protein
MTSIRERQTRSLAECQEALAEYPASLVLLEITSTNLERTLDWLSRLPCAFPRARAICLAQRGLESQEWLAREFGCLAFTTSPRELSGVAAIVQRYFASLPAPELPFEDQVWAQLPWGST